MISSLTGTVAGATPPTLLLECYGVGYEVWMPSDAFGSLPTMGTELRVHTSFVVRDDSHTLYGFLQTETRNLFNALIRISGIGPKSALGLLSALDIAALARAVESKDIKTLTCAPGIGTKNAARILIELQGNPVLLSTTAVPPVISHAVEALVALGYPAARARLALTQVQTVNMDVADLVKAGLVELTDGKRPR